MKPLLLASLLLLLGVWLTVRKSDKLTWLELMGIVLGVNLVREGLKILDKIL